MCVKEERNTDMLFDSHAHLDDERFNGDRDEVLRAMPDAGVGLIMNVGADLPSSRRSIVLAKRYPFVYAAVGVHPHEVEDMAEQDLIELEELSAQEKVLAIGEIGLDYYYDNAPRDKQRYWFERQIKLAQRLELPIIIHCRDAIQDCIQILRRYDFTKTSGVMHCFSGSAQTAAELIEMGFYIAFGGAITFRNNKKAPQVVQSVPMERLLIETDCPYMTPEPYRGKRNDSRYVKLVAEKIAEWKELPVQNAKYLFQING